MAKLVVDIDSLVSVAEAIRTKGNTSEALTFPQGFVDAVGAIESGGGDPYEIFNSIFDDTITEFCSFANWSNTQKAIGTIFNGCSNLTKWEMPNLTKGLGLAFRFCTKLVYIDIGKPTACEANMFFSKPLEGVSVVIRTETMATLKGTFTGTSFDDTTIFYVPKNLIETYKAATNWSTYADCFKAIEDYPEITGGII